MAVKNWLPKKVVSMDEPPPLLETQPEDTLYVLLRKPKAFTLLSLICLKDRQRHSKPSNGTVDFDINRIKTAGDRTFLNRQEYINAMNFLVEAGFVSVREEGRKTFITIEFNPFTERATW